MKHDLWHSYYTPDDIGDRLLARVQSLTPRTVVDICAGHGNLLAAAKRRWPTALTVGNDRYRAQPDTSFDAWSRMDGRRFAIDSVASDNRFDLVVANPPFGKTNRLGARISWNVTDASGERLLRSHRMECAMTAASALLVGNDGILASILPETVVDGSSYGLLRRWLARSFERFDVQRLYRGEFCGKDLGMVLLLARRSSTVRIGSHSDDFADSLTSPNEARHFEIRRGRMISADTHGRGSIMVAHCAGGGRDQAYVLRQCTVRAACGQLWVEPGDILVSRIGRSAGQTSVFEESKAAVFTDCLFRVRGSNAANHEILTAAVRTGEMTTELTSLSGGLGAKFLRKRDMLRLLERLTI